MLTDIIAYAIVIAAVVAAICVIAVKIRKKRRAGSNKTSGRRLAENEKVSEIKGERIATLSFETLSEYIMSDPLMGKDGLPLQQELILPAESAENKRLCDEAMLKAESGMTIEALGLYNEAARKGSPRGKFMSVLFYAAKLDELGQEAFSEDETVEWLLDLAYKSKHPLGLGLELIFTAIRRPDSFDGVDEEEIENRKNDVVTEFRTALRNGDFLAHYLLISFYAGAYECIASEIIYEDDELYDRAMRHFTRYYNLYFKNKTLAKEFSFIFKSSFLATAFGFLSAELFASKKYFEAVACGKKALAIARLDDEKIEIMELVAAQIARAYIFGNGTEVDLKEARKYLIEAFRFTEENDCSEFTGYVREELYKKEEALKRLDAAVAENRSRSYFDLEEFSQKMAAFNERLQEDREREEQKRAAERQAEEERARAEVPPMKGHFETRGSDEYFVTDNGSAYKVSRTSSDKSEITVDRGWLYGIQTYKIKK